MKLYWTLGLVGLMAGTALAETDRSLRGLLENAARATGTNYIAIRSQLVVAGSRAVPELTAISSSTQESWQVCLVAGTVVERIQRTAEIDALINYDWRQDRAYNRDWERSHAGPVLHLAPLVAKRCREKALWWHYMEMLWKETEEHSLKPRMDEDDWRSAYRSACRGSPVYGLMLKVVEDRVRQDIGFSRWETRGDLDYLTNSKTNAVLPFLLEILPRVPVTDERNRIDNVLKWADTLAQPQDVPLIEASFKARHEEVPPELRSRLNALRERAGAPAVTPK